MRRNWQALSACATSLSMLIHSPRNWACMPRSKSLQSAAPLKDRLRWSALPKESPQRRGLSMTITDVHDSSYMWSPNSPFASHQQWKEKIKKHKETRLKYHSLLWFHMVSLLSSRVKPLFKLRRAWHQRAVARPQWRRRKHRRSPYPLPRCKDQTESLGEGNPQKPYGRFNNDVSTWLCTVHAGWLIPESRVKRKISFSWGRGQNALA